MVAAFLTAAGGGLLETFGLSGGAGILSTIGGFVADNLPSVLQFIGESELAGEAMEAIHKHAQNFLQDPIKSIQGVFGSFDNTGDEISAGQGGTSLHFLTGADGQKGQLENKVNDIMSSVGAKFYNGALDEASKKYMSLVPAGQSTGQRLSEAHKTMLDIGSNFGDALLNPSKGTTIKDATGNAINQIGSLVTNKAENTTSTLGNVIRSATGPQVATF